MIIQWNSLNKSPLLLLKGTLKFQDDKILEIPGRIVNNEWGQPSNLYLEKTDNFPNSLTALFYSIETDLLYSVLTEFPPEAIGTDKIENLLIGLTPYGDVNCLGYTSLKSIILKNNSKKDILKNNLELTDYFPLSLGLTCRDYRQKYLSKYNETIADIQTSNDLFRSIMKQFHYRFIIKVGKLNEKIKDNEIADLNIHEDAVELDYVEEALYDGTHDKLHDGGLMQYHQAGKPKKLKIQMHKGRTEWSAFLWFDEDRIREIFDRFYGAHPDTKTDFIIHIDAEKNKYELGLFRYGLKEPSVIPEDAYQMIVFKNQFECYRSQNYDQPRGAWIW